MAYDNIPKEKFKLANAGEKLSDKKFDTKPVGYFQDAFNRFKKNKSSMTAAFIILALLIYAIVVPFVSNYDVNFRDGYYKTVLPKCDIQFLADLGWDGCSKMTVAQAGYDYYTAIGYEANDSSVKKILNTFVDPNTGEIQTFTAHGIETLIYSDLPLGENFIVRKRIQESQTPTDRHR